jgi:hypothetical protein
MTPLRSRVMRVVLGLILFTLWTSVAFAQQWVRVTRDQTTIWSTNRLTIQAYVDADTVLEVVRRRGDWYEVIVPAQGGNRATIGLVAVANVVPSEEGPQRDPEVVDPPASTSPQGPPVAGRTRPSQPPQRRAVSAGAGLRGFGHIGVGSFLASRSFDAVLGDAPLFGYGRGPWYGGGAQFQSSHGWFVEGGVAQFRKTGERVFVFENNVFRLGTPETLNVIPVTATGGFRFDLRPVAPFVGVGAGRYFFSETTRFDLPDEKTLQQANSYHAVAGIEFSVSTSVGTAVHVQYTRVPDALSGGVATAFGEPDLGGVQLSVRLLIGR